MCRFILKRYNCYPTVINTSVGQENQITATVRNGRGAGVVGVPITFDGGGITRTDPTGATGTVTLDKLLFNADATITAKNTAYGLSGSTKVVVSDTGLKVSFVNAKGEDITKGGIKASPDSRAVSYTHLTLPTSDLV